MRQGSIRIVGARQHNLKNLDVQFHTGELTVVTGPSGSGKSSLVFDTLFAEGQRRYVETFSAYARQFLDRMDKPQVDRVEGVPAAIAIDQTNPVRSSRSTVGTMTELNDHLKLLFARLARLYDRETALEVRRDSAESIYTQLQERSKESAPRLVITFPVELPASASEQELEQWLLASGFTKIQAVREQSTPQRTYKILDVVVDRLRLANTEKARVMEAIEMALRRGNGHLTVYADRLGNSEGNGDGHDNGEPVIWKFSTSLHCPQSSLSYSPPTPSLFSFNSPHGACPACKGFGRIIGVDYGLVIPDARLTLRAGAIKVFQTPAWKECHDDLMRHAERAGIPRDTAWGKLTAEQQRWVIEGNPDYKEGQWSKVWYGVKRFFSYLETKSYKMHIRVLLSKYRSYTLCPTCHGARLQGDALLWRIGSKEQADRAVAPTQRHLPAGAKWSSEQLQALPGLSLHDLMLVPIWRLREFFDAVRDQSTLDPHSADARALAMLMQEICTRLKYLCDVGIGYLSLDRQSRTLSGGEVQRINLTTALGTSLVNTLFVLDEPSIGLHPRDMDRITQAMLRLRDAGNTLVVVEHDPAVMLAADRILDMGPGPGERGGQIVFDGTPQALRSADTLTGAYLGARKQIGMTLKRMVSESTPRLILEGAAQHNLRRVDLLVPLQRLVCITGVSGSGKSSLIQDVLAPALMRHFGRATESPGRFERLLGAEQLGDVVFVDQSPIGKTARSNPASYVGAWDAVRQIFAALPLSKQRNYNASKFSFNSGDGRCPGCGGSGFEHVEMQFLSDVYLRCPDCDGKRYRPEILEITLTRGGRSLNVFDVLDLTVSQAIGLFAQDRDVVRALQPLVDVGLEYVKLGQPVPTLSGGESQRLKLAGFLTQASREMPQSKQRLATKGILFLFDEPTTGLHFEDISKLVRSLRRLLDAGHSVLVIEHNLDVIRASDWMIDLGPEGGEEGGSIVAAGRPEDVKLHAHSHTAAALRNYDLALGLNGMTAQEAPALQRNYGNYGNYGTSKNELLSPALAKTHSSAPNAIHIINAREHNLKGLSVHIPHGKFTVISGVSGSGKSSLAFDILFNEGQRRYLESLNAYARSIVQPAGRPEVDAVLGIPPTVAIEQRLSRGGRKSTVGTATEVWHFLRLLYVKLGVQHCVHDNTAVQPQSAERIAAQLMSLYKGRHIGILAPLVIGRKGVYTDLADSARTRGYTHLRVDGEFLPTTGFPRLDRFKEHTVELPVADVWVRPEHEMSLRQALTKALEQGKGVVHVMTSLEGLKAAIEQSASTAQIGQVEVFSTKRACPVCSTSYPELDPRLFSYNSKHGWCPDCVGTGKQLTREQRKALDDSVRTDDNRGREQAFVQPDVQDISEQDCASCGGTRLNKQARFVQFHHTSITQVARWSVREIRQWAQGLTLSGREAEIGRDLIAEIKNRLEFLEDVGLGYLTLDRGAPTLSGGEAQRIRLAAQLGSNLQGVCYVLDEPTIGLHARDNQILLSALGKLSEKGNTLVVVEHDEETIRRADHIIDIGPSAGKRGGSVVAQGSVADIMATKASATGRYLRNAIKHPLHPRRPIALPPEIGVTPAQSWEGLALTVNHAALHNLVNVTCTVPLKRLVAITGVSGSGKSTFARDVLLANVYAAVTARGGKREAPDFQAWQGCESVLGWQALDRVLEVDQTPIGKTPRSCPATYIGFWDEIRKLFAQTLEAKARGYSAGRFSFNTGQGRCPSCEGQGMRTIEMSFLPDVKVLCEVCHGARFNPETLAVSWRGKSIGEVLQMEVDDALPFFASMPAIAHPLQLLQDVGLGYLTLGQPSPTLSGGEAQRIKLVTELSKVRDDVGRRGNIDNPPMPATSSPEGSRPLEAARRVRAPHTLYVLDEPTVGLHMQDVEKLIHVLHRLVNAGHSVIVIEHDLDVIAEADWIIDLGPEGGKEGGKIVAACTPEQLVQRKTHTGTALAPVLSRP